MDRNPQAATHAGERGPLASGPLSSLLRSSPFFLLSVAIHVSVFALLATICIGVYLSDRGVDLVCALEQTPEPSPTPEPDSRDDGKNGDRGTGKEKAEFPSFGDFEDSEPADSAGDPESESDQPLSNEQLGGLGMAGGSPQGAYSPPVGSLGCGGCGMRKSGMSTWKGKRATRRTSSESDGPVVMGLDWLANSQEPDGRWSPAKWGGEDAKDVGVTGLALLAFTGAGHSDKSGKYRRTVSRAASWLVSGQSTRGCFAPEGTMYDHAVSLMAVLDLYAYSHSLKLGRSAEAGLAYLLAAQNEGKGWRYHPRDGENDVSVTAWCAMALKAAEHAGLEVPEKAWRGIGEFLDEVTDPSTGQTGYLSRPAIDDRVDPFQRYSMTACGVLCRLITGADRKDPAVQKGTEILMANLPDWNQPGINSPFYYYWFYGSLVMFHMQGDDWKKWNRRTRDLLVQHQSTAKGGMKGSWDPETQHHFGRAGGRVVSTAFAVLTLETSYRYLVINK